MSKKLGDLEFLDSKEDINQLHLNAIIISLILGSTKNIYNCKGVFKWGELNLVNTSHTIRHPSLNAKRSMHEFYGTATTYM